MLVVSCIDDLYTPWWYTLVPVSYTHLDVYKRQSVNHTVACFIVQESTPNRSVDHIVTCFRVHDSTPNRNVYHIYHFTKYVVLSFKFRDSSQGSEFIVLEVVRAFLIGLLIL